MSAPCKAPGCRYSTNHPSGYCAIHKRHRAALVAAQEKGETGS